MEHFDPKILASMPEAKLRELLLIASARAERAEKTIRDNAYAARREAAELILACALLAAKGHLKATWGALPDALGLPCGDEHLKSIALRRRSPSPSLFKGILESLRKLSTMEGLDLELPNYYGGDE